jgi:hypothetical protein
MSYYRNDLIKLYKFLNLSKENDVILDNQVGDLEDIQEALEKIYRKLKPNGKLAITYYNHLWEPLLKVLSYLGWRRVKHEQSWLDEGDIKNLLELSGFDVISQQRRLLLPLDVPHVSNFVNKWIAHIPIVNHLCLTTWVVARKKPVPKEYSVSIVVPVRNEAGNIPKIIKNIPKFGKWQEIIFVEGHSTDSTWDTVRKELGKKYPKGIKVAVFRQKGKGKADAVRLGFKKAKGDVLMILDGDLTVDPKDLKKFYKALSSDQGEFINGSRLVYPMEKEAMRTLNKLGNKIFSLLFTFVLGQRFKDTLCGTKVLFKKDYEKIVNNRKYFGEFDPFGDFDLIFGAVKLNLKIVEIPVRYKERKYGSTNIDRFRHGWQLLKMTWFGFRKFKAW